MTENVYIRKIPLPFSVRAFTLPDSQGDYNIYINQRLSPEQQEKSLAHEKKHIQRGDFLKEESASSIENAMKGLVDINK